MPRARRPATRKHHTAEKWQELMKQYEQSGLSQEDFCKKKDIAISSFHRWRRKLRSSSGHQGFLELQPQPATTDASSDAWLLELDLPGGGRLRIRCEQ